MNDQTPPGRRPSAFLEPAPTGRSPDRMPGESYREAVSRLAGERDAARHDLDRLQREVARLAGLRIQDLEAAGHDPALVAQAWHDVTCPEGGDCRDRPIHSMAQPLASTGVLDRFLRRLRDLERRLAP